jgi:hypothetical protein
MRVRRYDAIDATWVIERARRIVESSLDDFYEPDEKGWDSEI